MGFKDFYNKAAKKVSKLKDSKPVTELVDKTVEYLTEPKTPEQHVKDGAANVALTILAGVVTGGASIPAALAWAAGEEALQKTVSKTAWAKKLVAERRKKKDGPKPQ